MPTQKPVQQLQLIHPLPQSFQKLQQLQLIRQLHLPFQKLRQHQLTRQLQYQPFQKFQRLQLIQQPHLPFQRLIQQLLRQWLQKFQQLLKTNRRTLKKITEYDSKLFERAFRLKAFSTKYTGKWNKTNFIMKLRKTILTSIFVCKLI